MFEVPWKAPVPVREKGQLVDPWVAVPDAAQGIEVASNSVEPSLSQTGHVLDDDPLGSERFDGTSHLGPQPSWVVLSES